MKKLKAWTLAELIAVFICLAILTMLALSINKPRAVVEKVSYQAAFKNLKTINEVVVAKHQMGMLPENPTYCEDIIDAVNTSGTGSCTSSVLPTGGDDKTGTPNFRLSNQSMFYGFEQTFAAGEHLDYYGDRIKVWVNIDGFNGKNLQNYDVLPFWIYSTGRVVPIEINDTVAKYLRASVAVIDKNEIKPDYSANEVYTEDLPADYTPGTDYKQPNYLNEDSYRNTATVIKSYYNLSYMEANCMADTHEYTHEECDERGYDVVAECDRHDYKCFVHTAEMPEFSTIFQKQLGN